MIQGGRARPATSSMLPQLTPPAFVQLVLGTGARTAGQDQDRLSTELIRSGLLCSHVRATRPAAAVAEVMARLSTGMSDRVTLTLAEMDAEGDEPRLLMVRYRHCWGVSLKASVRRYDRAQPGVLGGLLSELRAAAARLAPMYTPEDALRDNPFGSAFDEDCQTLETASSYLKAQYAHLGPEMQKARLATLGRRDAARLLARHGHRTYLDEHTLGYTLGTLFLSGSDLDAAIRRSPGDLQRAAQSVRLAVTRLNHLRAMGAPVDQDERLSDFMEGPEPAFLVTGGTNDRNDPLGEYFEEMIEQSSNAGFDSWPLCAVAVHSLTDIRRVVRQLRASAMSLAIVRRTLLDLGAVPQKDA